MSSDRRKRKIVNIGVQKAIALRIICHSILFVWSVFLVCLCLLNMTRAVESGESMDRISRTCLSAIGLSTLVVLPVIVYDSIKFSHRMAGPVMRLKNLLPLIGVETLDHVSLRKNDFWQELAEDTNAMLDRVEALRQATATPANCDSTSPKHPDATSPANVGTHA